MHPRDGPDSRHGHSQALRSPLLVAAAQDARNRDRACVQSARSTQQGVRGRQASVCTRLPQYRLKRPAAILRGKSAVSRHANACPRLRLHQIHHGSNNVCMSVRRDEISPPILECQRVWSILQEILTAGAQVASPNSLWRVGDLRELRRRIYRTGVGHTVRAGVVSPPRRGCHQPALVAGRAPHQTRCADAQALRGSRIVVLESAPTGGVALCRRPESIQARWRSWRSSHCVRKASATGHHPSCTSPVLRRAMLRCAASPYILILRTTASLPLRVIDVAMPVHS